MDAADLRIFATVARLGAMNRAAGELHTVQSNVTARIRLLEDDLGVPLFRRNRRGVVLTSAGRRLLPYAEQVAHVLRDARRAAQDDGQPKGPLIVGSLETTAALRLPPILTAYAAAHPDVDLVLTTGTTSELIDAVVEHRVEGAFVCGPANHPALDEEVVVREELALVTAPGVRSLDALARKGDVKIVVLRAGCSYRERLEASLAARGVTRMRRLEFGTIEGILGCVSAGLGVTLLPKAVVELVARDRRVTMHALPPAEARVETVFVRRRDAFVSSALTAFIECARQHAMPLLSRKKIAAIT
jgi:DNA-binding transcriptional LysR family regulator